MKLSTRKTYKDMQEILNSSDPDDMELLANTNPCKGFFFSCRNPEGFMVDVFVKTRQTKKSKGLVGRIIASRPDWFTEEGTRTMYASLGTVRNNGTVAWSDYIWARLRPAVMTMKWYDSLNRMEIEISGKGFSGYGWEDEDRILILEV